MVFPIISLVNAIANGITLLIFLGTTGVGLITRNVPSSISPKLWRWQLLLTVAVLVLSITHCVLVGLRVFQITRTDPYLLTELFWVTTWTVLVSGLFMSKNSKSPASQYAWTAAGVSHTVVFIANVMTNPKPREASEVLDIINLLLRLVCITGLIIGSFLQHIPWSNHSEPATSDETTPLLSFEANEASDKNPDSGKKQDTTSDGNSTRSGSDGTNDDEDDSKEKDEDEDEDDDDDKKELDEFKKRPFKEYLASFSIFLPHMWPSTILQWSYVMVVGVCTVIERALNVVIPFSLGHLINSLATSTDVPWQALLNYLILSSVSAAGVIGLFESMAQTRLNASLKTNLSMFAYNHIMGLSCDFFDSKSTSRVGRILDRGDAVAELFTDIIFDLLPQIADLFISMVVLGWLFGGYLCFIAAMTIILFAAVNTVFLKKTQKLHRTSWRVFLKYWSHLFESQSNWATIAHFNQISREKNQFSKNTAAMIKKDLIVSDFYSFAHLVRQIVIRVGFVAASVMALCQIVYGSGRVGDFVMLVTYWSQVMAPVNGLIRQINRAAQRLIDAERLLLILEKKPTVTDAENATEIDFRGGAVEFENVTFSYDGSRVVSEDISFKVEAGQTVAIVGETGGGKSTLLKLLFRFYDPTKGRVLIDGQDLRNLKQESFRDLIGYVPQDPALFERSILDNVRYPNESATEEQCREACQGAVLHDKIMSFTKGYKQKVGEHGTRLSGGEQQRLAIARCIIKKPRMLLLDEATSSVDSVTESKIHECFKDLCKGRTTFIIAHRLSTILHADLILVIKNGKLVEAGPHRKLIKQDGAYRELWAAQLKLQAEKPDDVEGDIEKETTSTTKTDDIKVDGVITDLLTGVSEELESVEASNNSDSSCRSSHSSVTDDERS